MVHASQTDTVQYRDQQIGNICYVLQGGKCIDRPVDALVVAVYQSEAC